MQRSSSTSQRYLALVYGTQRLVNSSPHLWGRKYRRGSAIQGFYTNTEWTLSKPIFAAAISKLGVSPNIDLFASRLNFQIQPYVTFHSGAIATNAFYMSWKPYLSYIFPPFCPISRILQKIQEEKASVLAVILKWPTQIWWPYLISLLRRNPIIPPNKETLYLPSNSGHIQPLYSKLHLLICLLSGYPSKTKEFHLQLPTSSSVRGGSGPLSNTNLTLVNGNPTILNKKLSTLCHCR